MSFGLPASEEPRVAHLVPPKDDLGALLKQFGPDLLLARVFSNPADLFGYNVVFGLSIGVLAAGLLLLITAVKEPRTARLAA